ncbi:type II toxin-antitoxin system RelE/ParE family toxin [Candidatus Manganitrophus noduliformans]|uniref:Type II toxin-antitoxin system RelE/ParE family toxin n=1 Tax=Candidatus Manganitrophus noduliformans TaxID=2606439 RepID=A0A7X6DLN2_9BACT|nr:type II toxin-antitoxin system RelE/ParE family toxin [Candidatus Manganitrophus noduliformans]NKE69213.1 type II toxin-antitoxin system RelE/ParE family toxin [Candidatus Manganitrophus noduliformans]
MANYKILIKPSAVKEIEALPKKDRQRIIRRIRFLSNDPRPSGYEKLSSEEKYRIRQGAYRIIYSIADENLTVVIVKVGHRREVYR